jgi:hypothetical protein
VACSKGGGVKVNGDGTLRGRWGQGRRQWRNIVYGLRKRAAVVHSEAEVEAVACSESRDKAAVCSGLVELRTAGGGSNDGRRWRHNVSTATEE